MSQLRDDTEYTRHWVREPQGRGTLSILYTCTFTLLLCVYTAVHLNIPPAGEPRIWHYLRKVKWMFIAIFAPEVVLFTAIYQFYSASTFCREMDKIRADQGGGTPATRGGWWNKIGRRYQKSVTILPETNIPCPPEPFTLTYGFYVVMGGLAVDVSDMHNHLSTVTLSPFGVLKMARLSSWKRFAVSNNAIHDKSKADALAKLLVVFQVSWLFLQCVARSTQRKPLTILEVHTLVHAACAMLMYGLWFKKPLDVRDATVIVDTSGFEDELALELIGMPTMPGSASSPTNVDGLRFYPYSSSLSKRLAILQWGDGPTIFILFVHLFTGEFPRFPECKAMRYDRARVKGAPQEKSCDQRSSSVAHKDLGFDTASGSTYHAHGEFVCMLFPGQTLDCGLGPRAECWEWSPWTVASWSLTAKDVLRWNRAARAYSTAPQPELDRPRDSIFPPEKHHGVMETASPVCTRADNFRWHLPKGKIGNQDVHELYIPGLLLVTAVYGAVHLALWRFAFPSHAEMLLWKISGCVMSAPLILYPSAVVFARGVDKFFEILENRLIGAFDIGIVLVSSIFMSAFGLLYIFCRFFIVMESFLSLRVVPVGVYEGITWADYIPHI